MSEPLRLGIAGLGTVGTGVVKIVQKHGDMLAMRAGRAVEITAVSARDAGKDRGVDLSGYEWVDDAADLAGRADVDVVVEMIGGSEGLAKTLVKAALSNGKHVVTANKALLAHHGFELAKLAEDHNVSLAYEAAVAGGIPIIKAMREGFAGNRIDGVFGILNGTCNYMLTAMRETGRDFDVILKEAQEAGYAETPPDLDIDGIDAGHKLALLSSIAFGVKPDFGNLKITGIRGITADDIAYADEFGYRIKLLGIAKRVDGKLMQVLEPCLVPLSNPIGTVEDVYNAVCVVCDSVETPLLTGKGAGEGPTASAVMSDIVDIARGFHVPTFGIPADDLQEPAWMALEDTHSRYYLRLMVLDQPGVIADISAILRDEDISIEGLLQRGRDPGQPVPVVLTTHEVRHGAVMRACAAFNDLDVVTEEPCLMRIEALE
ncbi:MAG: homoserine dehydrogenase [Alphaproteobacteria bacterium]